MNDLTSLRAMLVIGCSLLVGPGWLEKATAGELAFDSLAFVPEAGAKPELKLPAHPELNWTRVSFAPRLTNGFPEELKPRRSLKAPAKDITALAAAEDELWLLSTETKKIYRLETTTGAVKDSFAAQGGDPAGLCRDGNQLWQTDGGGKRIYSLDRSGKVVKSFGLDFQPQSVLVFHGELLAGDRASDIIHRIDRQSGKELGTIRGPEAKLTGLTAADGRLWCSHGHDLICFDRERGLPVCGFGAAGADGQSIAATGLAADGANFWYADNAAGNLLQIAVSTNGQWRATGGGVREETFDAVYANEATKDTPAMLILQNVPFLEMPGQRFLALRTDPPARAYFRDDLGNISALVELAAMKPGGRQHCRVTATMWEADRRMVVYPDQITNDFSPRQKAYAAEYFPINGGKDPSVTAFARQAAGAETNIYWRARKAHDALVQAVYYREPEDESVAGVLREGFGVCRNYSAAMESFGRVLGVPMLDAWAPRHETTFLLLPGVGPAIMEVTQDALDAHAPPVAAWRGSRWFLGAPAKEITTGVRGFAMHTRVLLDGTPYSYRWHCWLPESVATVTVRGSWSVVNPENGRVRRY